MFFQTKENQTYSEPNQGFFSKTTKIRKSILHIPIHASHLVHALEL